MKIAVVGATGLVGGVMLQVLEERGFANCEIVPAASPKSVGKAYNMSPLRGFTEYLPLIVHCQLLIVNC